MRGVQSCSVMEAEMNAHSIEVSVTEFNGGSEDVRKWERLEVVKSGKEDKSETRLIWGYVKTLRRCRGGSFVESVTFVESCHAAKGIFCVSRCGAGAH